jgi:hypothetical protein
MSERWRWSASMKRVQSELPAVARAAFGLRRSLAEDQTRGVQPLEMDVRPARVKL